MTMFHRLPHPPHARRAWTNLADDVWRNAHAVLRASDAAFDSSRGVFPPVNLNETDEGFVLSAELPGVAPENIDVSLEGSTVTLSGERKIEYAAGDGVAIHRRERPTGTFRRAFELPSEIDLEAAKAVHKNGVLELTLPKSAAVKPRQIEVETR